MYFKTLFSIFFFFFLVSSCDKTKDVDDVTFDNSFLGARLDSIEYLGNNKFRAKIYPSFEPVNDSPYFAFGVSAKSDKNIEVELDYINYKHRYIPKLSPNKKDWIKIQPHNIIIDTLLGKATLKLKVSKKKLYVAAQEIESSEDTYHWMNNLLREYPQIKKIITGKTVLGNNIYGLEVEKPTSKNAIVLIARQHPPETPGGSIGFKAFFEELISETNYAIHFRENFNIYTFPLLNPDGADAGNWRHNANGADLNRDWIEFTQPETKVVKEFVSKKVALGHKIRFAIDFHTSYSGPYLLILDSTNEAKTKGIIPKWIKNIERTNSFKVEERRRNQKLPYCYNYFYNELDSEAVTYEEGDEINRNIIVQRAKLYARELMNTLSEKHDNNEFKN